MAERDWGWWRDVAAIVTQAWRLDEERFKELMLGSWRRNKDDLVPFCEVMASAVETEFAEATGRPITVHCCATIGSIEPLLLVVAVDNETLKCFTASVGAGTLDVPFDLAGVGSLDTLNALLDDIIASLTELAKEVLGGDDNPKPPSLWSAETEQCEGGVFV